MSLTLFLPCAAGIEPWLADEVSAVLPRAEVRPGRGGVSLRGGEADVMALNLECRLPQRVLIQVAEGPYRHEDDLYAIGRSVSASASLLTPNTRRVDGRRHSRLSSTKM